MQITYTAARLAKFILSSTGEKELNEKGQEVNTPRRLSAIEASQRRHFNKAIELLEKTTNEKIEKLQNDHKNLIKEKRDLLDKSLTEEQQNELLNADKDLLSSVKNLQEQLLVLINEKHELNLTDETKEVVKKYLAEFGEKSGFVDGDDQAVEELEELFK